MTAHCIEAAGSRLDVERFAAMVGASSGGLPAACIKVIEEGPLGFTVPDERERDVLLLAALRGGEVADLGVSGPHRAADWERGWDENLREFEAAGLAPAALVPKYNHHRVLRLGGRHVRVADTGFEYTVYTALRHYYFQRYFAGLERVVEFGCGTGTSLLQLAGMFPELQLCGLDWATSSQQILARLSAAAGRPIEGRRFDMFAPSGDVGLAGPVGVLTSAAMEQLGRDHGPLLDFLLQGQPQICLHIEPLLELYDPASMFDEVARRYHERRNYLHGFLPRLQQLEEEGKVEILELRRTGFGSFFHEGYSILA